MHRTLSVIAMVTITLSLCPSAHAITLTQSFSQTETRSFSKSFTGLGSANSPLSYAFDLQQFDPSMGTLTDVDVNFMLVSTNASSNLTNNNSVAVLIDWSGSSGQSVSGPGFGGGSPGGGGNSDITLQPGQTRSFGVSPLGTDLMRTFAVHPSAFANYTGSGTVTVNLGQASSFTFTNIEPVNLNDTIDPNLVTWSGSREGTIKATVTYTFDSTVIPEPATAVMALLGASGLLLRRRRTH